MQIISCFDNIIIVQIFTSILTQKYKLGILITQTDISWPCIKHINEAKLSSLRALITVRVLKLVGMLKLVNSASNEQILRIILTALGEKLLH